MTRPANTRMIAITTSSSTIVNAALPLDLAFQQKAETVDAVEIERIPGRDNKAVLVTRDWDHLKTTRVLRLDLVDDLLRDDDVGEIDPAHLGLGSDTSGNVVGRNQSLPDENVNHASLAVAVVARFV